MSDLFWILTFAALVFFVGRAYERLSSKTCEYKAQRAHDDTDIFLSSLDDLGLLLQSHENSRRLEKANYRLVDEIEQKLINFEVFDRWKTIALDAMSKRELCELIARVPELREQFPDIAREWDEIDETES